MGAMGGSGTAQLSTVPHCACTNQFWPSSALLQLVLEQALQPGLKATEGTSVSRWGCTLTKGRGGCRLAGVHPAVAPAWGSLLAGGGAGELLPLSGRMCLQQVCLEEAGLVLTGPPGSQHRLQSS